jgi:hypothetical protein
VSTIIATLDIRGERLCVVRDECPEHPLNRIDAPFCIDNYNPRAQYWRHHESPADRPIAPTFSRDTGYLGIYFDSDGNECEYFDASGALYVDREDWQAYAGSAPSFKMLRAQLAECRAYWRGEVYGFISVKTFRRADAVYATSEEGKSGSRFGFYGAEAVRDSMPFYVRPAFRSMLRKLARGL